MKKNIINKLRAKGTLALMSKGDGVLDTPIPVIPKTWEKFPGTEDVWHEIVFPKCENTTASIYKGREKTIFKPHAHPRSSEHFCIINKGGKIQVITDTEMYEVSFPDSVYLPIGKPHAIKFITDTTLFIMWHPKMKETWDGDFLTENQINFTPSKT